MIPIFKQAKAGGLVSINDADLIIRLNEDGLKDKRSFLIKEVNHFYRGEDQYHTLLLDHVGSDLEFLLVLNGFKENYDIKLYEQPPFFEPDRRSVVAAGDNGWLLDGSDFPAEIFSGDIVYTRKVRDEVFGQTAIVEYVTQAAIVNYEILIIETNFRLDGWIEFYEGRIIQEADLQLVP